MEQNDPPTASRRGELALIAALAALTLAGGTVIWFRGRPDRTALDVVSLVGRTDFRIDLNSAPAHELRLLPGVGQVKAAKIVEWRQERGPFSVVDDLRHAVAVSDSHMSGIRRIARCAPLKKAK